MNVNIKKRILDIIVIQGYGKKKKEKKVINVIQIQTVYLINVLGQVIKKNVKIKEVSLGKVMIIIQILKANVIII